MGEPASNHDPFLVDIDPALLEGMNQFAEQMPGGFFIYQADGEKTVLYANDILLRIYGCQTFEEFRDLTGGTFDGMVHPEDLEAMQKSIQEQVQTNQDQVDYLEYRIIRKDGAIRWVDDYGRLIHREPYGSVYYVIVHDITDLRASREENIRKTEVIKGLSVDFSVILLLNLDTGTMRVYRDAEKRLQTLLSSLSEQERQSPDWRKVLPLYAQRYVLPEDRERYLNEVSETRIRERMLSEPSYTVDYRCPGKDGALVYMQMSAVRITSETHHPRVVMGYRDITEQILRLQSEMTEKLNMEMELEQEKRANEIKSSFLFNISHDIRTPMNAIMGFTELVKRHLREPERLEGYLQKVDESNRHMLALIDDLLEMSQIGYGRVELKSERCNLREQLHVVLDMFRGEMEEKHIALKKEIDLPDEEVFVDALRFRRVMSNLLSNAVKFTPDYGIVTLAARRKQVSESGYARYEFRVSDNGPGISKEFMRKIFDAFEREDSSTKTGKIGAGLGLTITKTLLDIMGGSIRVDSQKGHGAAFTVDLPMKKADAGENNVPVAPPSEEDALYKADGEKRILLVEDIEINRMLAETILEDAGFLVESVPDGCDAVEAFLNHPPRYFDLVLMDIQMPVMNGYEATRAIRALGRPDTADIPIIALSANARDEDRRMSMDSGMNHHIAKPFDVAQLITTINDHLARRKK
ncbi:MAG: response regulator [Oscillibacter sp.]|nr:response regulator [Oscillibacter sp.]